MFPNSSVLSLVAMRSLDAEKIRALFRAHVARKGHGTISRIARMIHKTPDYMSLYHTGKRTIHPKTAKQLVKAIELDQDTPTAHDFDLDGPLPQQYASTQEDNPLYTTHRSRSMFHAQTVMRTLSSSLSDKKKLELVFHLTELQISELLAQEHELQQGADTPPSPAQIRSLGKSK